ncbi:MAG: transporter ATP-binding protein [Anaerocolumna sp.]|nr:transporter ATP-binding protein [Anaerocolumna sp.]
MPLRFAVIVIWRISMSSFVELVDVKKYYRMGEVTINAVDGIDFQIEKGEFVVIVGPSGAGKTTVLNILGGMDTCSEGNILVDGIDISTFNTKQLTNYRRDDIGFVFQFYNLIQNLTALENVELALQICKNPLNADDILKQVGLGERLKNFPAQLSGGEQQRVSIARALAKNPKLLLCDEPTGALDYNTGKAILKLLQDTCRQSGMTVIVITHNSAIAPMADRVIKIKNGKVSKMTVNENPVSVETIEW